jgi:hypothetical protein
MGVKIFHPPLRVALEILLFFGASGLDRCQVRG